MLSVNHNRNKNHDLHWKVIYTYIHSEITILNHRLEFYSGFDTELNNQIMTSLTDLTLYNINFRI